MFIADHAQRFVVHGGSPSSSVGARCLGLGRQTQLSQTRRRPGLTHVNLEAGHLPAGGLQRLSSSALLTTLTELSAIAAPASTGLR